jgi:isoquinoline 1-oxidoreductase beta subunit
MSKISNVSRRDFLKGSGAFVLGAMVPMAATAGPGNLFPSPATAAFSPNLYLSIANDGLVTVTSHRSEMGQGIRTAIAQIVADELNADWSRVQVGQAPGDKAYGDQNTDGSQSIRLFYDILRNAGATARMMLLEAGAKHLGAPVEECFVENHQVLHINSDNRADFGELATIAASMPVPRNVAFKNADQHRYIGKPMSHVDIDDILDGKGTYGADVRRPNMVYAVIKHPPVLGAQATTMADVSPQPGFIGIEVLEQPAGAPLFNPVGGIAVIANDTHTAMRIADGLNVEWSASENDKFDSTALSQAMRNAVNKPGDAVFDQGKIDRALSRKGKFVEAVYETPFLSHAPMEPPCAVAEIVDGHCHVWGPLQNPQGTRSDVARWLKVDESKVTVDTTLLGGAFGRKSKPDFAIEAVELARRLERPVKVIWTREDDIQHDYYHAASAQYHKAKLGRNGLPEAWLQRTAFPSISTTFAAEALKPAEFELEMGFTNIPYRVRHQRFEATGVKPGVRIGWMRSVCNIFHSFSCNVFVDEMATAARRNPIDYRLALLGKSKHRFKVPGLQPPEGHEMDIARIRNVIERVRDLSTFDKARPDGHGLGFAVHHSFRSYVATVIEASVEDGNVKVHNAWVSLDCGTYINPDTCTAQMEGAVVFGLSLAQMGEITMTDGRVNQSNFHDYPVLRMPECPDIEVDLVASTALPAGVGEPGVPPVAPALINAIYAASGNRIRSLPIKSVA